MTDQLDEWFDLIERAAMSKALEKGDERLAGEAAEARERIREEFEKLRRETERVAARWAEHDKSCREAKDKGWTFELLLQYVNDTSDGFECLPGCDSYAHEEMCPETNTVAAFRLLRERIAELESQLAEAHRAKNNALFRKP